tara:strand:+ start:4546 stop:5037 length:492 start_codon:yes stop_codon:yes gene_type:complete
MWENVPRLGVRLIEEACVYLKVEQETVRYSTTRAQKSVMAKSLLLRYLVNEYHYTLVEAGKVCNLTSHDAVRNSIKISDQFLANDVNLLVIYSRALVYFKPLELQEYSQTENQVTQMTKNGRVIRDWGSIREASIGLGVAYETMWRAISGQSKTCKGFKWKYK